MTAAQVSGIEWTTELPPPLPGRAAEFLIPTLAVLRERPGMWAIVRRDRRDRRGNLCSNQKTLRKHGCEAEVRVQDGESVLYARWVGES